MRIYYKLILVLIFIGCSDFTEIGLPNNQLTKEVVFKDENLANSAMASIYRSLEEKGFLSGGGQGLNVYLGCLTDELLSYENTTTDLSQLNTLSHNSESTWILTLWKNTYNQLYNINLVIEGLQKSTINNNVRERLLGEAYFLRGYLHLLLSETFGKIPLAITSDYTINRNLKRLDEKIVYEEIEKDLMLSLARVPETLTKGNRVRVSKMAVYSALVRLNKQKKQWQNVIQYSSLIIQHPDYQMELNLDNVFLKNSSSVIWSLLPTNGTSNTFDGNMFIIKTAPPKKVALRDEFIEGFEEGDERKIKWIGVIQDQQKRNYYYPNKYKQSTTTTSSMEYTIVMRVEDVILSRAEAYAEIGDFDKGLVDLNAIRQKAKLPSLSLFNRDQIRKALLKERKYEFFTEQGFRFFDLKQFDEINLEMLKIKPLWKSVYALLPIPDQELQLNPKLEPQNEGY